jgi:hypothetical protein
MDLSQSYDFDDWAVVLIRTVAFFSSISSLIIIYFIFKSRLRLGCIYNRLMFGMSLANILGCVSLAWNTQKQKSDDTNYLGNVRTCEAKAFFEYFGLL